MGVQRGEAPLAGCRDRVPAGVWGKAPQKNLHLISNKKGGVV